MQNNTPNSNQMHNNRPYLKNRMMINNLTPVNQLELQDARIALSSLKMKMNQKQFSNNINQQMNIDQAKQGYNNQHRPQTKQQPKPQNYNDQIGQENNYNQSRPQTKQQPKSKYIPDDQFNERGYYNQNQPQIKKQQYIHDEPDNTQGYYNQKQPKSQSKQLLNQYFSDEQLDNQKNISNQTKQHPHQYNEDLRPKANQIDMNQQHDEDDEEIEEEKDANENTRPLHQGEDINKYEVDDTTLSPCPDCGKMFAQLPLSKHVKICKKVFLNKRKPFDSKKTRLVDEEQETLINQSEMEAKKQKNKKNAIQTKIPKWKKQSEQLRKIAQANREEDSKVLC